MPMSTWNLKLVNVQAKSKDFNWDHRDQDADLPLNPPCPDAATLNDLVRIPANSKSRFSLEEEHAVADQQSFCNCFLRAAGMNHDLAPRPAFTPSPHAEPYHPPRFLTPFISHDPEDLATDLYRCSPLGDCTFTVEDKDPSVLWQMSSNVIFDFWYTLMTKCPDRWKICKVPDVEILKRYRVVLDTILPKSLIGESNAFSWKRVPYAYFTVKYKCFRNATQQCCNKLNPGNPAPLDFSSRLGPTLPIPALSPTTHACGIYFL